jgi:hypothetical protein
MKEGIEGIDRQGMHTFWKNYVSKLKKKKKKKKRGAIHASGACASIAVYIT